MSSFACAECNSSDGYLSDGWLWAKSLALVRSPSHRGLILPDIPLYNNRTTSILNYSDLYATIITDNITRPNLKARAERYMPHPSDIVTGDTFQTTDYRGVGTYYAIWLLEDVFVNHPMFRDVSQLSFVSIDDDKSPEDQNDAKLCKDVPLYYNSYAAYQSSLQVLFEDEILIQQLQDILLQSSNRLEHFQKFSSLLAGDAKYANAWSDIQAALRLNSGDVDFREIYNSDTKVQHQVSMGCFALQIIKCYRTVQRENAYTGFSYCKSTSEEIHNDILDFQEQKNMIDDNDDGDIIEENCVLFSQEHFEALSSIDSTKNSNDSNSLFPQFWTREEFKTKCSSSSTCNRRKWQVYFVSHTDEMGYSIPTIFSFAPLNYFATPQLRETGTEARECDLQLLPNPLNNRTSLGRILHFVASNRFALTSESQNNTNNVPDPLKMYATKCSQYTREVVMMDDCDLEADLKWYTLANIWQLECDEFGEDAVNFLSQTDNEDDNIQNTYPPHHCLSMRSIYLQARIMLQRHAQSLRNELQVLLSSGSSSETAAQASSVGNVITSEADLDLLMQQYWNI